MTELLITFNGEPRVTYLDQPDYEAREIRKRLEAGEKPPMTLRRRVLLEHHAAKRRSV